MDVAANDTVVLLHGNGFRVQSDTQNALTDTLFDFASDNIYVDINGLSGIAGGRLMNIGAGSNSASKNRVSLDNVNVTYSASGSSFSCININQYSRLILGTRQLTKTAGGGSYFSGAYLGFINTPYYNFWIVYPTFSTVTFNGAGISTFSDISTENTMVAGEYGKLQVRLSGQINRNDRNLCIFNDSKTCQSSRDNYVSN